MTGAKFDSSKLERLNNPDRLRFQNPGVLWGLLGLHDPEVLIDIGAGTGFFARHFSEKMAKGRIYACDISDVMLSWMQENLPAGSKDIVVPTKMEETSIPLADEIADLVYLIDVYHELEGPAAILREAFRLLKKKGRILILDWKDSETPMGPPLHHRVSLKDITDGVAETGFEHIETHEVFPYHHLVVATKTS